jgi:pimeloyl-ACP methyl ester carboxylesterase
MTNRTFSYRQDLYQLLKFLGVEQAHLMGCSMGGTAIIDFALEYPKMVNSLILVGSGLSGYEFAGEPPKRFDELIAARERGDYDQVAELEIQLWVDGRSRTPDQVDPLVRERVREMLLCRARGHVAEQQLKPAAVGRLTELDVPTLIIVGDLDDAIVFAIADLLAANIQGARKVIIPDTAHLPNMEKPEQFNRVVLEFLREQ